MTGLLYILMSWLSEVEDYAADVAVLSHDLEGGFPLGPGEDLGDRGAEFASGDQLGGFLHVVASGPDGADYLKLAEDDFWQGEGDLRAVNFAQED